MKIKLTKFFIIILVLLNFLFISINQIYSINAEEIDSNSASFSSVVRPPEESSNAHYFTNGIADGGVYYIINKRTGKYLDVQNASTDDGTKLWTYKGNNTDAQKFQINYLGQDSYELVPLVGSKVVQVLNINEDCDTIINTKSKGDKKQEFYIKAVNSNTFRIYSNMSNYVLTVSHTKKWTLWPFNYTYEDNDYVISKSYTNLATDEQDFAEWEIVSAGIEYTHKIYYQYYLKNVCTGLYLEAHNNEIVNNTLVYATNFTSLENQQWDRYYDAETNKYILKPGHRTDMALYSYREQIGIYDDQYPRDQRFLFEYVDVNPENRNPQYYIKTSATSYDKYLAVGEYDNSISKYKVINSDNEDLWELIMVPHKGSKKFLIEKNNRYLKTINSYSEKHILIFMPEKSGIYEFNLNRVNESDNNIIMGLYEMNKPSLSLGIIYNLTNSQKSICYLEEGKIYYALIFNSSQQYGKSYTLEVNFSTIIYLHGINTYLKDNRNNPPDDRRAYCTKKIEDYLINKSGYAPILNNSNDMSSTFVQKIDPLTNIIPLTAPIYLFRGHGASDVVEYNTGTSDNIGVSSYLTSYEISKLDLSGGGFVAWIACNTGDNTTSKYGNMPTATVNSGAKVSLGFKESIYTNDANYYAIELIKYIIEGYTVQSAVQKVSSKYASATGLKSFIIVGDGTYKVISNQPTKSLISQKIPNHLLEKILEEGYTLESIDSENTLRYTKMVNGMLTGDYYELYYTNGKLVDYYKSPITVDINNIKKVNSTYLFNYNNENMKIIEDSEKYYKVISTKNFDYYLNINGNWTPVRYYQINYETKEGFQDMDLYGINMINGEYVSTKHLYFGGE